MFYLYFIGLFVRWMESKFWYKACKKFTPWVCDFTKYIFIYNIYCKFQDSILSSEKFFYQNRYYLEEATRLRTAADREQEPLPRVMLLLESVLCFVLTGRVMELELDTKGAFTIYRQTIAYIKLIHSMPQRFRASPPDTFNKLDILR